MVKPVGTQTAPVRPKPTTKTLLKRLEKSIGGALVDNSFDFNLPKGKRADLPPAGKQLFDEAMDELRAMNQSAPPVVYRLDIDGAKFVFLTIPAHDSFYARVYDATGKEVLSGDGLPLEWEVSR